MKLADAIDHSEKLEKIKSDLSAEITVQNVRLGSLIDGLAGATDESRTLRIMNLEYHEKTESLTTSLSAAEATGTRLAKEIRDANIELDDVRNAYVQLMDTNQVIEERLCNSEAENVRVNEIVQQAAQLQATVFTELTLAKANVGQLESFNDMIKVKFYFI